MAGKSPLKEMLRSLPFPIKDAILRGMGQFQIKSRKRSNEAILAYTKNHPGDRWAENLRAMARYGRHYESFIREFTECEVILKGAGQRVTAGTDPLNPTVICVVKNDLMRVQMFMAHYRRLGVKQFAILDDHSADGTLEYLQKQKDVILFHCEKPYISVRRSVWINKIIDVIGLDRWYLIADSDEIFDYPHSDTVSLRGLAEALAQKGRTRTKALMLDMFASDGLYSRKVKTWEDIEAVYRWFYPKYVLVPGAVNAGAIGGGRQLFFRQSRLQLTKYPLIYIRRDDVISSAHVCFPYNRNKPDRPETILKHYKFLPGDQVEYARRVKQGNFYHGSEEYKFYTSGGIDADTYAAAIKQMRAYEDFDSVRCIDIMGNI